MSDEVKKQRATSALVISTAAALGLLLIWFWVAVEMEAHHLFFDPFAFLLHPTTAAWVQGICTIVAVCVAAWVGTLPIRTAAKEKATAAHEFALAVAKAARSMEKSFVKISTAIEERNNLIAYEALRSYERSGSSATLQKLIEESLLRWPSPETYMAAVRFRDHMEDWTSKTRDALGRGPLSASQPAITEANWTEIVRSRKEGRDLLDELERQLNKADVSMKGV